MPTTAEIRRASSAWSAPGSLHRRQPADAERARAARSRSVTIRTERPTPAPAAYGVVEVHAGRQLVALAPEAQPVAPRPAAVLEAALRPGVGEQVVERAADRHDEGPRAALRDGRGRAGARARRWRPPGRRRAGSGAATAAARRRRTGSARPSATRSSASSAARRPGAARRRRATAGSTGRGPKPAVPAPTAGELEVAAGRGRRALGPRGTRSASVGRGRGPAQVEPAQQLELLGAGQRDRPARAAPGSVHVAPRRRTAGAQVGDPAPGATLAGRCARGGGHRSRSRRACRAQPAGDLSVGVGPAGGLLRSSRPARRGRRRARACAPHPVGVAATRSSAAGRHRAQVVQVADDVDAAAARSSRSSARPAPRPSRSGRAAAAPGAASRVDQLVLGEHLADQRVVRRPRAEPPSSRRRLSWRISCGLGDAERRGWRARLSSGAQAGSMPNAWQNRSHSSSPSGRPVVRHGDDVEPLGRQLGAPRAEHGGQVEGRRKNQACRARRGRGSDGRSTCGPA